MTLACAGSRKPGRMEHGETVMIRGGDGGALLRRVSDRICRTGRVSLVRKESPLVQSGHLPELVGIVFRKDMMASSTTDISL